MKLRKKIELETQHLGLGQKIQGLSLIRSFLSDFIIFFFGERADFNLTINKSFDYKILPIVLRNVIILL